MKLTSVRFVSTGRYIKRYAGRRTFFSGKSDYINALCDEYLRLSYHGLRAKDKFFNATLKTDFDPSIGKIDIVPQDIGSVLMNLPTNLVQNLAALMPGQDFILSDDMVKAYASELIIATRDGEFAKIIITLPV